MPTARLTLKLFRVAALLLVLLGWELNEMAIVASTERLSDELTERWFLIVRLR